MSQYTATHTATHTATGFENHGHGLVNSVNASDSFFGQKNNLELFYIYCYSESGFGDEQLSYHAFYYTNHLEIVLLQYLLHVTSVCVSP